MQILTLPVDLAPKDFIQDYLLLIGLIIEVYGDRWRDFLITQVFLVWTICQQIIILHAVPGISLEVLVIRVMTYGPNGGQPL